MRPLAANSCERTASQTGHIHGIRIVYTLAALQFPAVAPPSSLIPIWRTLSWPTLFRPLCSSRGSSFGTPTSALNLWPSIFGPGFLPPTRSRLLLQVVPFILSQASALGFWPSAFGPRPLTLGLWPSAPASDPILLAAAAGGAFHVCRPRLR